MVMRIVEEFVFEWRESRIKLEIKSESYCLLLFGLLQKSIKSLKLFWTVFPF